MQNVINIQKYGNKKHTTLKKNPQNVHTFKDRLKT